ncbi:MAG: CynX/NimT family MFS transporter [Granulosicoccus sp.]
MATASRSDAVNRSAAKTTQWLPVFLLFFSGCTAALHIGKIPAALPGLTDQLQLTLTQSGLIVSLYALMIATLGCLLGLLVRQFGYVAFAMTGLGLVAVGSLLGSMSTSLHWLLPTRVLEGLGWIMSAIAFPPMLTALAAPRDRLLVLGIWGGFVPLGAGAMLIAAPWLQHIGGWQLSWQVAGAASLLALLTVWKVTRETNTDLQSPKDGGGVFAKKEFKKPEIWLYSFCFFAYSCQFVGVTAFLPTLFIDTSNWSLANTSRVVALVVLSNVLGNVVAGYLLRRGFRSTSLLILGAAVMGISALIVFTEAFSMTTRIAAAFMLTAFGGLVPGTLFASVPRVTNNPWAIGLLNGIMLQFSGIGQLAGGVLVPGVVESFHSWQAGGVFCLLIAAAGCLAAALIPRFQVSER